MRVRRREEGGERGRGPARSVCKRWDGRDVGGGGGAGRFVVALYIRPSPEAPRIGREQQARGTGTDGYLARSAIRTGTSTCLYLPTRPPGRAREQLPSRRRRSLSPEAAPLSACPPLAEGSGFACCSRRRPRTAGLGWAGWAGLGSSTVDRSCLSTLVLLPLGAVRHGASATGVAWRAGGVPCPCAGVGVHGGRAAPSSRCSTGSWGRGRRRAAEETEQGTFVPRAGTTNDPRVAFADLPHRTTSSSARPRGA